MQPCRHEDGMTLARYGRKGGHRVKVEDVVKLSHADLLAAWDKLNVAAQEELGLRVTGPIGPEQIRQLLMLAIN